jgi:hypothetical protein
MNRLNTELLRLYGCRAPTAPETTHRLFTRDGLTRCLVLELAHPPDWATLSALWRGVQLDLDLPAPAIAVNGSAGLQLWFSLQSPVGVDEAQALLNALSARYLRDVPKRRLRLWPTVENGVLSHAQPVPAQCDAEGRWSAFVAPDLVPVFADTPYLDIPPSDEGQADTLAGLKVTRNEALSRAREGEPPAQHPSQKPVSAPMPTFAQTAAPGHSPQDFLLGVMNDATADMGLRVEAAKALLPYFSARLPHR